MKHLLSITCALMCAMNVLAATINVAPGSSTLRTAVIAASSGDILVLSNGEYTESSSIKPTVPLTIQAAEETQPILKLSSRIEIKAGFTIKGLTIQSTTDVMRMVTGDSLFDVTIDNCHFLLGSTANSARTIYAADVPQQLRNIAITNCTFDGGTNGTGRFIYLYGGSVVTPISGSALIDHCTFYNSTDRHPRCLSR